MTARTDALHWLAREIVGRTLPDRAVVAVDGIDGAGKTVLARELAEALARVGRSSIAVSVDGFHRPRSERYARGRESGEGFYRDSYDYDSLRVQLIGPYRAGSAFRTAVRDVGTDAELNSLPVRLDSPSILIIDGIFLHRPELVEEWDFSIWLDVPRRVADARLFVREGSGAVRPRYEEGQRLYIEESAPAEAATVAIDNSDFDDPRVTSVWET